MLRVDLLLAQYLGAEGIVKSNEKQKAVQTISDLLSQVDFQSEVVPCDDPERMIRLLTSLKGEPLNEEELKLVKELTQM